MIDEFEDIGGEWTAAWRRLSVLTKGWLDGRDINHALWEVKRAALVADDQGTKGAVQQLDKAVKRLESEVIKHQRRLIEIQKEVGYLVADVVQSRADAPNTPGWVLEQDRINELLAESDIGLDRVAQFYGLDRKAKP